MIFTELSGPTIGAGNVPTINLTAASAPTVASPQLVALQAAAAQAQAQAQTGQPDSSTFGLDSSMMPIIFVGLAAVGLLLFSNKGQSSAAPAPAPSPAAVSGYSRRRRRTRRTQ